MIINANALSIPLADKSVHCIVTSPPYWALRNYGVAGQLGLEQTPEEYIANMVSVFRECWRVLRDDGTLWLNIGDSYAGSGRGWSHTEKQMSNIGSLSINSLAASGNGRPENYISSLQDNGLKPKDLVGIPWRLAFALQADGWYLRSDIIWAKPNPMPESVTDRPTKSHEYIFLLTKRKRYFYDAEAIRDQSVYPNDDRKARAATDHKRSPSEKVNGMRVPAGWKTGNGSHGSFHEDGRAQEVEYSGNTYPTRNRRTVWTIPTAPYKGAHFATFPPALVEPCIKAGTSERGVCPKCGAPWVRVVEKGFTAHNGKTESAYEVGTNANRISLLRQASRKNGKEYTNESTTLGFRPSCKCDAGEPIPALVFDPFVGSGTTVKVAYDLGRRGVGLDLSLQYLDEQATTRIHNGHTGRLL